MRSTQTERKQRTAETVCLLSKLHEAKHHVNVRLDMDEMDLTAAESKATYEEIKKYVAEHNDGMKVSNLYIAQVKRKCGIELAENFNLSSLGNFLRYFSVRSSQKYILL